MGRDGRKPWEIPVVYNEDRWESSTAQSQHDAPPPPPKFGPTDNGDERDADDVEELLRRPDREEEREYECNDTTPVNYGRGPHEEEFGVDEGEFDEGVENPPLNYEQGPHEEEFGVEDNEDSEDDEFEQLDGSPEFDEEI